MGREKAGTVSAFESAPDAFPKKILDVNLRAFDLARSATRP